MPEINTTGVPPLECTSRTARGDVVRDRSQPLHDDVRTRIINFYFWSNRSERPGLASTSKCFVPCSNSSSALVLNSLKAVGMLHVVVKMLTKTPRLHSFPVLNKYRPLNHDSRMIRRDPAISRRESLHLQTMVMAFSCRDGGCGVTLSVRAMPVFAGRRLFELLGRSQGRGSVLRGFWFGDRLCQNW